MIKLQLDKIKNIINNNKLDYIYTHNDLDGLTSYYILKQMLIELGKDDDIQIKYINSINEETIDKDINNDSYILFADLGSAYVNILNELNLNNIIILDHHTKNGKFNSKNIIEINPHDYNTADGGTGATLSYLLYNHMCGHNEKIADISVLGAFGDGQQNLSIGFNKIILNESSFTQQKFKPNFYYKMNRPLYLCLKYFPYLNFNNDNELLFFINKLNTYLNINIDISKPIIYYNDYLNNIYNFILSESKQVVDKQYHKYLSDELKGWLYTGNFDLELTSTIFNSIIKGENNYNKVYELLNNIYNIHNYNLKPYRRELFNEYRSSELLSDSKYKLIMTNNNKYTGIIASMYMNYDMKPIVGISEINNNLYKISLRGLTPYLKYHNINLSHIANKFGGGGHLNAAGLILSYDNLDNFVDYINKIFK